MDINIYIYMDKNIYIYTIILYEAKLRSSELKDFGKQKFFFEQP
jgi:hypothetical protein